MKMPSFSRWKVSSPSGSGGSEFDRANRVALVPIDVPGRHKLGGGRET
jgi:hypothetical protein